MPLDQLADRTSDANAKIMETVNALNESNRDVTKSNRFMIDQIEKATNALQKLAEFYAEKGIINERVISSVSGEIERLQRQVTTEARNEFQKLSNAVKDSSSAAARVEASQVEITKDFQSTLKLVADEAGKSSAAVETLQEKQADVTRETTDNIKGLKKDVQSDLKSVSETLGQANEAIQRLDENQAKLANETKTQLKDLKNDVQSSLVASSKLEETVDDVSKSMSALNAQNSLAAEKQSLNPIQGEEISDKEVKEIIEAPSAKSKKGKSDPNAGSSIFAKHNGYNIYRPKSGEGYEAEGATYDNIGDAKNALSRLPKADT